MYTFYICLALSLSILPFPSLSQIIDDSFCSADTFHFPTILGADLLSIAASPAHNFTTYSLAPGTNNGRSVTASFCNVTVQYGHPGWNDTINVQVWLPSRKSWSGRLQAFGGGGYSATFGALYQTQAVDKGDIAIGTDAGHEAGLAAASSPRSWALTSPGNVNLYLLEDFASRSLHEMAMIGKAITRDFYKSSPKHSYFSGCSGGGRQGLMLAQKYPNDFDGILAVAPAIYIESFIPAGYWAQQVMHDLNVYPPPCEIDAFTLAAIDHCDALDGVKDGVIASPDLCHFQAASIVGECFSCNGTKKIFTEAGARIVQAAWNGPQSPSGKVGWFGLNKGASLTSTYIKTQCSSDGTCSATPTQLLTDWIRYFIAKDPNFDESSMTTEDFYNFLEQSKKEYHSKIGTADPDLHQFSMNGGKMITWHGLADEVIPPNGTSSYYQQVREIDPTANSFYRVFEAPGVGHCYGGQGHVPNSAFDQLVEWVEKGVAPDTLVAVNPEGQVRELWPYPLEQSYIGGDVTDPSSFQCVEKVAVMNGGRASEQIPLLNRCSLFRF